MNDKIQLFKQVLSEDNISLDPSDCRVYGADTSKNFQGTAACVLFPRSAEDVQKIVQLCRIHKLPLVPSGGRTGLCGGATASESEIVLSLAKMSRVLEICQFDRIARVQAGVTTEQLKGAAAQVGLDFPISLASQGTSQIGGNIATNAGGIHFLRYGPTRNWVLGLTVVTGTGEILRTGKALYKDNTGYDLRSLFIGSEGTLGIITEATLALTHRVEEKTRVLCALNTLEKSIVLLDRVRHCFPELSAFELFTDRAIHYVLKHHELRDPFATRYPCYILVELESPLETLQNRLENSFGKLIEDDLVADVVIAQSSKQSEELMNLREFISETLSSHYTPFKNDVSVPVSAIPGFTSDLEEGFLRLAPTYTLVIFGHVGDGNLHVNWIKPENETPIDF
ncbi:MAG: FAD-binding oxidoreductase, partial [Bdellovibrionales bacterium]|nr:FAD-binding oxidoreductase [Bdellovibrionales bacterium]